MALEECGAAIAPIPLLSSVGLAAGVLRVAGPAVEEVLGDIGGGVVAALAVHPPGCRLPGVPMTLQHGRLQGHAVAVPGLPRAELVVTLASSSDGPVAAVARVGDGVTVHPAECTDPTQPLADVDIDTDPIVTAPVEVESALATPLVAAAADLVGVAGAALARVDRACESHDSSSANRSGLSRGSSTHWPTTTSPWSAPAVSPTRRPRASTIPRPASSAGWTAAALAKAAAARGGGRLLPHRGSGPRRASADLGTRHAPVSAARVARRLGAGR